MIRPKNFVQVHRDLHIDRSSIALCYKMGLVHVPPSPPPKFNENRFILNELFTVSSTLLIFSSKPLKIGVAE